MQYVAHTARSDVCALLGLQWKTLTFLRNKVIYFIAGPHGGAAVRRLGFVTLWAVTLGLTACSASTRQSPLEAPLSTDSVRETRSPHQSGASSHRVVWGLWEVDFAADHRSAEIVPMRQADMHLNVVRMLEVTPCSSCLRIGNITALSPHELAADLSLTHLAPGNLKLTGFDVRGILIADSDSFFPTFGRSIAWGAGMPIMVNGDGYTHLFNPSEFDPSLPGPAILKYIPGKLATADNLSSNLNPYVAYGEDEPRRVFLPGETKTRTVVLRVPDGPFRFGYAVDACWQMVYGDIVDPVTDFPETANCREAYGIDVEIGSGLGTDSGTSVPCSIVVYDHQGQYSIDDVVIEAPDLFEGQKFPLFSGYVGDEGYRFSISIWNKNSAPEGIYPLLVQVIDKSMDPNLGLVDAWQVGEIRVGAPVGWVATWGGPNRDAAWDVATDDSGDVYVAGSFDGNVDFDPGGGTDYHTSEGASGAYLCKLSSTGEFQWAKTWGGAKASALAVDESGNVSVIGLFEGLVDFDPGPNVDERQAAGVFTDVFLSRFDQDGQFQWVRAWGAANKEETAADVAVGGMGSVYVTGCFTGKVDFDPGPAVDESTSNGEEDVYLSKFDYYGDFEWVRSWGGPGGVSPNEDDEGWGVAADGSGGVYVVGNFHTPLDFDPGSGADIRSPVGWEDSFLSKFNSYGNFQWVRTWGGTSSTGASAVAVADPDCVYVCGFYRGTTDFDPGDGVDEHGTNGTLDCYLSRLTLGGTFVWSRVWGGPSDLMVTDVAADSAGGALLTGFFAHTVDLDPGPGFDSHETNGWMDAYLSCIDSAGEFRWGRSWGGQGTMSVYVDDGGQGIATDGEGNVYSVGHFENLVDFEPGPGVDETITHGLWDAYLIKFRPDGAW